MTAVIGILNKQAVAIAADSAVTISDGISKKIFNKANKIFTLSKCHPIGVMIYNNASFMATPWEVIIKVYRRQLANKYFNTVKEYQEDFIKFLVNNNYFSDDVTNEQYLNGFIASLLDKFANEITIEIGDKTDQLRDFAAFASLLENKLDKEIAEVDTSKNCCTDFKDYTLEMFLNDTLALRKLIYGNYFGGESPSEALLNKMDMVIYYYLKSRDFYSDFTGLIFVGYGEIEIYPRSRPVKISFAMGCRLRYHVDVDNECIISNDNAAAVCPFAQTDVIDTIIQGIAPKLENLYQTTIREAIKTFQGIVLQRIGESSPLLSAQIESIDLNKVPTSVVSAMEDYKLNEFIIPLVHAVETLSKEDLGEMAESLVYLTYLKRRMTNAEESVGGPVDVAIISKGDGFVWIKRKHYFRPELNNHFFHNYNKF